MKTIKKFAASALILGFSLLAGFIIVKAQSAADIIYPVSELGGCQNENECRVYCDDENNISQCVDFAEKHNLMSPEEIKKAKAFIKAGKNGPGGCKSKDECETYCDDIKNIEACLAFAEENDFMDEKEIKEARQMAKALKEGASLPGGCKNKEQCEDYCENTDHMNECVAFAEKAGFISGTELEEAKKAAKAIGSGIKPPGNCKGKAQCDAYCSESSHMEECLNFAEAAGFIPKEEAAMARKIMPLMMRGEMPGNCKSKEQCESYCEDESRAEECASFAVKAGFMSEEEYEMFKKTGGKGPGDCKGKDECEKFCANPENQETCFNFGKEHGLIPEEKLQEMREGAEKIKEALKTASPEVTDCVKAKVGTENYEKMQTGESMLNPEIGKQIKACFEEFMPKIQRETQQEEMGEMMKGESQDMMGEKIKNETMGEMEKEIKEKMMESGNYEPFNEGEIEKMSAGKEEIEKNIRQKIEKETRQRIEEEIKRKMMGDFNKTE